MRKRIALVAVVAAAAVAYTAYKKAKMQKVAQQDKDNPLIVTPLNGDAAVVEAMEVAPQAEEPSETETLEDVPVESVETETPEEESVPPETKVLTPVSIESDPSDPFGLDSFIHETTQIEPEEIVPQPEPEDVVPELEPEEIVPDLEPEDVVPEIEPEVEIDEEIPVPEPEAEPEVVVEEEQPKSEPIEEVVLEEEQPITPEPVVIEPVKPEVHETSTLTNTLLESYRIQCKVMMDGYPSNKKIDLIHHIEFKDPKNRNKFVDSLQIEYHEIEDSPEGLSATIRQTIPTDARVAYSEIVKLAEASEAFHGLYQGWVLVDCR